MEYANFHWSDDISGVGAARPVASRGREARSAEGKGGGSAKRGSTAWAYSVLTRAYLTVRRKVPQHLMAFLQDAHEHRGVLQQVGTVYQFRHIELQRHLAAQRQT